MQLAGPTEEEVNAKIQLIKDEYRKEKETSDALNQTLSTDLTSAKHELLQVQVRTFCFVFEYLFIYHSAITKVPLPVILSVRAHIFANPESMQLYNLRFGKDAVGKFVTCLGSAGTNAPKM